MNATSTSYAPRTPSLTWLALLVAGVAVAGGVLWMGKLAVVGVGGAFVFLLFIQRPLWGVYITTALLLLSGQAGILLGGEAPLTAAKLSGAAAVAGWVLHMLVYRTRAQVTWPTVMILAFLGWTFLATITGLQPVAQLRFWLRLVMVAGFFIITYEALNSRKRIRQYLVLLCLCGLAMSAISVTQYLFPQFYVGEHGGGTAGQLGGALVDTESLQGGAAVRVSGSLGHSNWLSLTLLLLLPLNVAWFYTSKNLWVRLLACGTAGLELSALVLTFTRMGLLISVCIGIILLVRGMVRITPQRIVAFLVIGALGFIALPAPYKERVLSLGQYTSSRSVKTRVVLQKAAWELWQTAPIQGLGVGGFGLGLDSVDSGSLEVLMVIWRRHYHWDPIFLGAHNMYLQTLVESGAVGLLLLISFFVLLIVYVDRAYRASADRGDIEGKMLCLSVQTSLLSFMLCAVLLHAMLEKIEWLIAALALALWLHFCKSTESISKNEAEEETARV